MGLSSPESAFHPPQCFYTDPVFKHSLWPETRPWLGDFCMRPGGPHAGEEAEREIGHPDSTLTGFCEFHQALIWERLRVYAKPRFRRMRKGGTFGIGFLANLTR